MFQKKGLTTSPTDVIIIIENEREVMSMLKELYKEFRAEGNRPERALELARFCIEIGLY